MGKVVLITGCSTGIGRNLAERLSYAGYSVAATARNVESLKNLEAALKLSLDVTSETSVHEAVEQTIKVFGRIDVLVNNAGYAMRGAVEDVPVNKAREMFDVNLFGVMRMVQEVAPHMRQQGGGRIINISSVVGKLVVPANGTYASSKFALEGLSDALRYELAPFGIRVVVVEPGSINTNFHSTTEESGKAWFGNTGSAYRELYAQYVKVNDEMRKDESQPEVVSEIVQKAIESRHPKTRYLAGFAWTGKLVILLGEKAWDKVVFSMFKIKQAAR